MGVYRGSPELFKPDIKSMSETGVSFTVAAVENATFSNFNSYQFLCDFVSYFPLKMWIKIVAFVSLLCIIFSSKYLFVFWIISITAAKFL